jgi:hypothetical protein
MVNMLDSLINEDIDFQQVVINEKDIQITYDPNTRDIIVLFEEKYINAREIIITITEHSGTQLKVRLRSEEYTQSNGLDMLEWKEIIIQDPSIFLIARVLNNGNN